MRAELKARYSVTELAELMGLDTSKKDALRRSLRRAGVVHSQRGPDGGYWLAKPAAEICLADVIRVIDGPLANVRGIRSEQLSYQGSAEQLRDVWVAVRASLRSVLEQVTLADLARGELPASVQALAADPDAWAPH